MIAPVGSATHPTPLNATPKPEPRSAKLQPAPVASDTVQLSSAAKIVQEATETPAQTAHEANAGDLQAKRLLAREAAEHAPIK